MLFYMANFWSFSKWFYRGEGNKTLVISNAETRQVLRLQKSRVASTDRTISSHEESNMRQEFQQSIKICKQIFIPLLGNKYVEPGVFLELPLNFMADIKDLVTSANKERPHFRLGKEVNAKNKFGVLMPDFCYVPASDGNYANESRPTFCVEIKPKCGTMPVYQEPGIWKGEAYGKVKESICKYCLLQWTKVNKEGKYRERSGYCPLDLFSADINRVWHALICLLKNPQNNLRIFHDGEMVYSGETVAPLDGGNQLDDSNKAPSHDTVGNRFLPLLHLEDVLRHSFSGDHTDQTTLQKLDGDVDGTISTSTTMFLATLLQLIINDSNESTISNHHYLSDHPICGASLFDANHSTNIPTCLMSKGLVFGQGGVLTKILDVQKLDQIGTDKAFDIFNKLCGDGLKDIIDAHICNMSEDIANCSIDNSDNINANSCEHMPDACVTKDKSSVVNELEKLTNFLIAASANDCSIMISFQEVLSGTPKNSSFFQDVFTGIVYKYSIAVVDLDRKESTRIPRYYQDYHDIIENYLHFNKNECD